MAIRHLEPDRIPLDLGGPANTLSQSVAKSLLRPLSIPMQSIRMWNPVQQLIELPERLLQHYQIDTRHIHAVTPFKQLDSRTIIDWLGFHYQKKGAFYTIQDHPLANAETKEDIDQFQWSNPHSSWFRNATARAKVHDKNGFAVVADPSIPGIFELSCSLLGWTRFFTLFHRDPELVTYIINQSTDILIRFWDLFLNAVGDYIHIVFIGDDYGSEIQPFMSPIHFRKFIKPSLQRLITVIKRNTKAAVMLHSCGAIRPLIPDLIEIGINILTPIQPTASMMKAAELKSEFGKILTFHGGFDLHEHKQKPVSEMLNELSTKLTILSKGGGYIFGFSHPILDETQIALFDMVLSFIHSFTIH